ncbi:MAG: GAF domain-containing sensor histidine kinase [Proteobacteria bacterium]|nr:GAF domain-containing sensor histidine kinase [Pseudomonadota bacterium]
MHENVDIVVTEPAHIQQHVLFELVCKLSVTTTLEQVSSLSVDAAMMAADMDCGAIFNIDDNNCLKLSYCSGISNEMIKKIRSFQPDSTLWRSIMKGRPLFISLSKHKNFYLKEECEKEKINTLSMIPIRTNRNGVLGCLCVASHTKDMIPYHSRNTLKIIAAHMGNKIVMSFKMQQETDRQLKALTSLRRISNIINKSEDLDDVFRNALNEITKLKFYKPNYVANIFLLDKDSDDLVLTDYRGANIKRGCSDKPVKIGECLCGLAAGLGRIIISNNSEDDERHTKKAQYKFSHKDICIPLISKDKTLGVMNITIPSSQKLDKSDYRILISICKQMSAAIYNTQLNKDIERYREKIKGMSIQLKEAKETERNKLARELHDQIGSNLTALGINLNMLKNQHGLSGDQNVERRIDETIDLVKQTSQLIREIVSTLRTSSDNSSLLEMVKQYIERFTAWTNIPVEIIFDDDLPRIPPSEELELFRIVQEALSNIAKYSKATLAKVEITKDKDKIRISVADNGVGFDPLLLTDKAKQGHFGISGMIERAKIMNGLCSIASNPGKGTNIIVEIR